MPARRRVVVTGVGALCGAGPSAADVFRAVIDGRSAMRTVRRFDARDFPVAIAAEVQLDGAPPEDPYYAWGRAAARMAVADAFDGKSPGRVDAPVFVGSALGGIAAYEAGIAATGSPRLSSMWRTPSLAQDIAVQEGLAGPGLMLNSSFASSADAIGIATQRIRDGTATMVLAGGSEAPITPLVLAGFSSLGALADGAGDPAGAIRPFDGLRCGCGLGEGAAFLLLEDREHAIARGATIRTEVMGYGTAVDAFHITQLPEDGEGLRMAMLGALSDAEVEPDAVGYINAHGTGTDMNDRVETAVIWDVFGERARSVPVSSTKAVTGHLLGAAGAMEAVITILALESRILPPTINWTTRAPECDLDYIPNEARRTEVSFAVSNSMGFGGHSASLVLARHEEATDGQVCVLERTQVSDDGCAYRSAWREGANGWRPRPDQTRTSAGTVYG